MENENFKKVGDIDGKELITDLQWATIMFTKGETASLGLNWGQVIALKNAAEHLIDAINEDLAMLPEHLREELENGPKKGR